MQCSSQFLGVQILSHGCAEMQIADADFFNVLDLLNTFSARIRIWSRLACSLSKGTKMATKIRKQSKEGEETEEGTDRGNRNRSY
jgi:hypothetical protein